MWCRQDARDAAVALREHGVFLVPTNLARAAEDYLTAAGSLIPVVPFSTVPGRTRGRHRAHRFSLCVRDITPTFKVNEGRWSTYVPIDRYLRHTGMRILHFGGSA